MSLNEKVKRSQVTSQVSYLARTTAKLVQFLQKRQ